MQRRAFLKLILPLSALLASCRPFVVDCLSNSVEWTQGLKAFADPVLGKAASQILLTDDQKLKMATEVCATDFVDHYRQQAAADFASGKTLSLDGWTVSETEALTHRAVYLAGVSPVVAPAP